MALCAALMAVPMLAQEEEEGKGVKFSGSVQSDMLVPHDDEKTGARKTEDFQTNTYADLLLQSKFIDAGLRAEYLEHPLPGSENDIKGWGVPHFYVKGKLRKAELTLGTFYEQFGSGLILRTYEERSLDIDNSLLGGRLVLNPLRGVTVKALSGRQRRYWHWNKALVSGADVEVGLHEWFPSLQQSSTVITLGASWVNKYEKAREDIFVDATHRLYIPKFVNAWDVRLNLSKGPWNLLAEYAQKTDDPSYANGYIYRNGSTALLSGSYSQKGLSILLQAKRSENMSFKSTFSSAEAVGVSSQINHLPAFTQEHTYTLPALYPYATQLADGEWAYQGELTYLFKRRTALGGPYGMQLKVNFSYVRAIEHKYANGNNYLTLTGRTDLAGTEGYRSAFFKWGDQTYYKDFNVQLSRKLSKNFKLNLMYMNQVFNKTVVEGHGGMVRSNIFVADGKWQMSPKTAIRAEAQYLSTPDDEGDWLFGLLELSLAPRWMFTVSDMYNAGSSHIHYYAALATFSAGAHRLQAGYVRTQAGYNCSGGVCRYVPAIKGFTLSYNYSF